MNPQLIHIILLGAVIVFTTGLIAWIEANKLGDGDDR